jgi:hypothetical protein
VIVDPRLNEQPPTSRHPQYAENDCAGAGNTLYLRTLWLPGLLFVGIVVAAALGSILAALIVAVFFLAFSLPAVLTLLTRRPLGIRMDQDGIRIGGVQAAEECRGRVSRRDKPIRGFTRAMHVYACDWDGVRRIKVLTDRQELVAMAGGVGGPRAASDYRGVWWSYLGIDSWAPGRFVNVRGTNAALVFEVDVQHASFQATRPPRGTHAGRIYDQPTMTWVIPTNDPDAIKAALVAAQPPVYED